LEVRVTLTLAQLLEPCKRLRAANDSGPRDASKLKWIVLHDTEGGSAASNANYFHTTAEASTQLVVDNKECYRCVPDLVIPWGAPGANTAGLHIEHCGYKSWTRADWLAHPAELRRSAAKAARWCHMYGIPRRYVGKWGLRLGRKGFTTHLDCSQAFPPNDGHSDPGPGFPKDVYMRLVKSYYADLAAP
jgi:hypothetical protein